MLEVLRNICLCNVDDSAFSTDRSQLTCSTNGRGLTYRAMIEYSVEVGNITASTLVTELQSYIYNTLPLLTIDVLGSKLSVVVECSLAINDLTAPLCPEPELPTHFYSDPLTFGSFIAAATFVDSLCGSFIVGVITGICHICKK